MDAWSEISGKVVEGANTPQPSFSATSKLKPSAKHKAAIRRLALRYPDVGHDRIVALEEDTADLPADMIEELCAQAARECRFFPTAAEVRAFAKRSVTDKSDGDRERWTRQKLSEANLKLMREGRRVRWIAPNFNWQMVAVGRLGDKHRCDAQGGVESAYFDHRQSEWLWPDGSIVKFPKMDDPREQ